MTGVCDLTMRAGLSGLTSTTGWFVAVTEERSERSACERIQRLGFHAFAPTYTRWALRGRRKIEVTRALFPTYLFVAFDPDVSGWSAIRRQRGVIDLLRNHHVPIRVPNDIMATLLASVATGEFDETGQARLKPGDAVVIESGPFAEFAGVIKRARSSKRMEVFLSLFGGPTTVVVPLQELRRA